MLTSFGFSLLNWGIFYSVILLQSWTSTGSSVTNCRFSPIIGHHMHRFRVLNWTGLVYPTGSRPPKSGMSRAWNFPASTQSTEIWCAPELQQRSQWLTLAFGCRKFDFKHNGNLISKVGCEVLLFLTKMNHTSSKSCWHIYCKHLEGMCSTYIDYRATSYTLLNEFLSYQIQNDKLCVWSSNALWLMQLYPKKKRWRQVLQRTMAHPPSVPSKGGKNPTSSGWCIGFLVLMQKP